MGRECCGKQHTQQSLVPTRVIVALIAAGRTRNGSVSEYQFLGFFFQRVWAQKMSRARKERRPRGCDVRRELGLTLFRKPLQRERAQKRRRTPSGFVKTVQNRSTSIQFILRSNCSKCLPSPELMEIGYRVFNRLSISGRQNTM